jgi:hypothetical protein
MAVGHAHHTGQMSEAHAAPIQPHEALQVGLRLGAEGQPCVPFFALPGRLAPRGRATKERGR